MMIPLNPLVCAVIVTVALFATFQNWWAVRLMEIAEEYGKEK